MTAAQLIEELQKLPGHMEVTCYIPWPDSIEESSGWFPVYRVSVAKPDGENIVELNCDDTI
jgi:hypothetical protein